MMGDGSVEGINLEPFKVNQRSYVEVEWGVAANEQWRNLATVDVSEQGFAIRTAVFGNTTVHFQLKIVGLPQEPLLLTGLSGMRCR